VNDTSRSPGRLLIGGRLPSAYTSLFPKQHDRVVHQLLFADCGITRYRDACELWLVAGADQDELTEISPGVAASIVRDDVSPETLTGRRFQLPQPYVAGETDRSHARFEFCHENDCKLKDCTIEFTARDGDAFLVTLQGQSDDLVTGTDSDLDVELEARCRFAGTQTRNQSLAARHAFFLGVRWARAQWMGP
jgi:hypothetical protein